MKERLVKKDIYGGRERFRPANTVEKTIFYEDIMKKLYEFEQIEQERRILPRCECCRHKNATDYLGKVRCTACFVNQPNLFEPIVKEDSK